MFGYAPAAYPRRSQADISGLQLVEPIIPATQEVEIREMVV
jgi:hypothetical protein